MRKLGIGIPAALFATSLVANAAPTAVPAQVRSPAAVAPLRSPTLPAKSATSVKMVRVPTSFAHVQTENVTINGKTSSKAELLKHLDPDEKVTLPNGKVTTAQDIIDRYGRSEDQMKAKGTSLVHMHEKTMANPGVSALYVQQKNRYAAARKRVADLKAKGWVVGWQQKAPPGGSLSATMQLPAGHRSIVRRFYSPCQYVLGHKPTCQPDFVTIDMPPWTQDVGDPSTVGAATSISMQAWTTPDGDASTCGVTWDNSGSIINSHWDILKIVGSETTNAKSQTFSGKLAIYVAGSAMDVPGVGDVGADEWMMNDTFGFTAGGRIPLIGPLYIDLSFGASATVQMSLIGEKRAVPADPVTSYGGHCHVGVEPTLDSLVTLTGGIGIGVGDLIDLLHVDLKGESHPVEAWMPAHATLDLMRSPPGGHVAFDAHLKANFMRSKLWFEWRIFDLCWSTFLGTVCLAQDIFGIDTSGSVEIASDPGWDGIDDDLIGGSRAIAWHPK